MSSSDVRLPAHHVAKEPLLSFHPSRREDSDVHPLKGLRQFGPYSRSLVNNVMDPIRVGLIVPHGTRGVISGLLNELRSRQSPQERYKYLIEYPGFAGIYGARVVPASSNVWLQLPKQLDRDLQSGQKPHLLLAEAVTQALSAAGAYRTEFDILLMYLPERWEPYYKSEEDGFDLHDHIKATSADAGIPTQIVNDGDNGAIEYHCRASVMWRLSIALYTKAGGVPWKILNSDPGVAYLGLSYALQRDDTGTDFVTCCSQIFDSDGAGLEFLAYRTEGARIIRDNPYLSRDDMRRVISRSLTLYRKRHGGASPKHLVVHKSTDFKHSEIQGSFDAWNQDSNLSLIQVQRNTKWRGIKIDAPKGDGRKGVPANYPCSRGSYAFLGGREVLLWTQGVVPEISGNFYKEGKGIPRPLLLRRFAGHGGFDERCTEVMGLTKMDWNNDALYNRSPVTLSYASRLASILKRVPNASGGPYPLRLFI